MRDEARNQKWRRILPLIGGAVAGLAIISFASLSSRSETTVGTEADSSPRVSTALDSSPRTFSSVAPRSDPPAAATASDVSIAELRRRILAVEPGSDVAGDSIRELVARGDRRDLRWMRDRVQSYAQREAYYRELARSPRLECLEVLVDVAQAGNLSFEHMVIASQQHPARVLDHLVALLEGQLGSARIRADWGAAASLDLMSQLLVKTGASKQDWTRAGELAAKYWGAEQALLLFQAGGAASPLSGAELTRRVLSALGGVRGAWSAATTLPAKGKVRVAVGSLSHVIRADPRLRTAQIAEALERLAAGLTADGAPPDIARECIRAARKVRAHLKTGWD